MSSHDDISGLIADIYEVAGALRQSGQQIARAEGHTIGQWHLLDALGDPSTTVARAARRLGLTRQAVQKTANELEASGLIEFRENPDHKNSPLIVLTVDGESTLGRINARALASDRARFAQIPTTELVTARNVLHHMAEATYRTLE
jgi:DNA-binding MarR family transcriptional regulator